MTIRALAPSRRKLALILAVAFVAIPCSVRASVLPAYGVQAGNPCKGNLCQLRATLLLLTPPDYAVCVAEAAAGNANLCGPVVLPTELQLDLDWNTGGCAGMVGAGGYPQIGTGFVQYAFYNSSGPSTCGAVDASYTFAVAFPSSSSVQANLSGGPGPCLPGGNCNGQTIFVLTVDVQGYANGAYSVNSTVTSRGEFGSAFLPWTVVEPFGG